MPGYSGGCLCGAVRYEIKGEPVLTLLCHCVKCQKSSGSMFTTNYGVPEANYVQQGETRVFHDKGDNGGAVSRYFCGNCGSPIVGRADALAGLVMIKAGTLDDHANLRPQLELFKSRSPSWVTPFAGTQCFAGMTE